MPVQEEPPTTSDSPIESEPLQSFSKPSRIHFPTQIPVDHTYLSQDTPPRASTLNSRTSPVRKNSLRAQKASTTTTKRRRVKSVDAADVFGDARPHRKLANDFLTPPRGLDSLMDRFPEPVQGENLALAPSDEYDLSHEDPRILQDVQRALKLKARREARLGSIDTTLNVEKTSPRSQRNASLLIPYMFPMSSSGPRKESLSSDVDFSPSIGPSSLHPVPASLDNGLTLDWSGLHDKSESRWKLTGSKRKGSKTLVPPTMVVDQQENAHADKISRLKTVVSSRTMKKAKITQDQLSRRYDVAYRSLSTGMPLNMAKVVRWYSGQETLVRSSLEKAEPFTWLQHLGRRRAKFPERSPWHLSALIVEEYVHAQTHRGPVASISEELTLSTNISSGSPSLVNYQPTRTTSHTSSNHLVPLLARLGSFEGGITFEPVIGAARTSLDVGSHQSGESSFSSLPIRITNVATSYLGSTPQGKDAAISAGRMIVNKNDEDSSFFNRSNGRLAAISSLDPKIEIVVSGDRSDNGSVEKAGTTLELAAKLLETPSPQSPQSPTPSSRLGTDHVLGQRGVQASLPPVDRISRVNEHRSRKDIDEEKAYELKSRLLEETVTHNHRIRQLLNRISTAVREYEVTQASAMASLGVEHVGLPQDLLDAFGHDPAAVTGATRRFRGWQAVDDIQHRLSRQHRVFETFLARGNGISVPQSVLKNPIDNLMTFLNALEEERQEMVHRATHVAETLKTVQTIHVAVKEDYKNTLSHTSVVYPELSHIVALEERYKDQYQQFWEFGMDTLTFLLDTVTPFWRTYGKTIGEDIQDFLIIPLYRNEFTGESKRYPILGVPARSLRHWLGLVLFFLTSISVDFLQARAAVSSATHYKLLMIPYESIRLTLLPFFWISIIIQWWAVTIESSMVLMQIGIIVWWAGWSVGIFT